MRRVLLATALLLVGALAGCFQAADEPSGENETAAGNVTIDDKRPDPVFEDVVTGPVAQPDTNATLDAAPDLQVGEWWRVRLDDPFTGTSTEFIRVVAAKQGDTYVFGMPHEGWWKEAVVFHTPAFGDVDAKDLSYKTHDILFQPLQFPLVDGATWETEFSGGGPMTASVERLDEQRAKVTFTQSGGGLLPGPLGGGGGDNVVLELTYDATIHEVVEFNHGTVTFTVIEHGYGFEGWITVPRGEKLVFFHGRIGPAMDLNLQPAAPTETVEINGGYNRMSFITAVQSITPGASGACRETATGPDGTTYSYEETPCTSQFGLAFHEAKDPDGMWNLEHVAGGGNAVFIEGIAYHQYDIHLPDGAIRSDHSHEVIR